MRARHRWLVVAFAAIAVLALALTVAGCAKKPSTPASNSPTLGLHSLETTVTVGDQHYLLSADFTPGAYDGFEVMTVTLKYVNLSAYTSEAPDIELAAYGSDGTPRVEPADLIGSASNESGGSVPSPGESLPPGEPRGWADITQPFTVKAGETGIVVTVSDGSEPDIRWLAR